MTVIFISFADVKGTTYQGARDGIICALQEAYRRHAYLLEGEILHDAEKEAFGAIDRYLLNQEEGRRISDTTVGKALKNLSFYLYRCYGKKVLIFLDEYDTPLQEAYVRGFWKEMMDFIRELFHSTFKTNPYMERSVLTGITRVSKESIFSDLNNLTMVTAASEQYSGAMSLT